LTPPHHLLSSFFYELDALALYMRYPALTLNGNDLDYGFQPFRAPASCK
jgi:hypothetical protein